MLPVVTCDLDQLIHRPAGTLRMFMTLLSQIADFGLLAMLVMAANAIAFTWLGGRLGIVIGQLYLILFILNLDLTRLPGSMDGLFYQTFIAHVLMINVLLIPAWVLGMLLRKMNTQAAQSSPDTHAG